MVKFKTDHLLSVFKVKNNFRITVTSKSVFEKLIRLGVRDSRLHYKGECVTDYLKRHKLVQISLDKYLNGG